MSSHHDLQKPPGHQLDNENAEKADASLPGLRNVDALTEDIGADADTA